MKSTHKAEAPFWGRMAKPVLIGVAAGAVGCLVLLLVFAAILAAQDIPQAAVTPMAVAAAAIGAFVGGFVAARIAKTRGILFGALCGLILYLLVMASGFAVLRDIRGTYAVVKLALMVVSAAVGGILGVNFRRR